MHNWKQLYYSLERLWSTYRRAHSNEEIGIQVLRDAMNPERYSMDSVEREAKSFGLRVDLGRDWQDLADLRDAFDPLSELGFSADTPAESVYQTAIQVRLQRLNDQVNRDGRPRWFYRGQRNHCWDTVPKLMRSIGNDAGAGCEAVLEQRVQKVRSIVARIMRAGLAKDDFEATAIAQHYSSELGIGTWLLDVTTSPGIALFFASDGSNAGEIGTLDYIEFTEWMLFSNRGESVLGAMRVASPASVLRISNQQAFFLQAPHPELFEEFSNRKLYFRQQDSVVFESEAFQPPLTRDLIYPTKDPTLAALRGLPSDSLEAKKLAWEPTASVLRAPDHESYLPVARALLHAEARRMPEHWEVVRDFDWEQVLRELCRLHAIVRGDQGELPGYIKTLHHLRRLVIFAVLWVKFDRSVSHFLELNYLQYCRDDTAVHAFRRCLVKASPFWEHALEECK
jgi:hypothetical protein